MQTSFSKKALIILNPNAGTGALRKLEKELDRFNDVLDYVSLSEIGDLRAYVNSVSHLYDIFIAAGGDGTVNSLASTLLYTDKILGVLPYGSGNGFAREMGFGRDLNTLKENIIRKEFTEVDILKINDSYCVNISGTGIDSFVAHSFQSLNRRGLSSYIISTFRVVRAIKPLRAMVTGEGISYDSNFFLAAVANTRQFGNNAIVAPCAKPDDGFFDIVLMYPFPKILMPLFAIRLMTGTLRESKYLHFIKTDRPVKISTSETRFHIDGEPLIFKDGATIEICKMALRVLSFPKH